MVKDLVLIPRLLYSVLFVGFAISATRMISMTPWVIVLALIFTLSFMWQYLVLHYALKQMTVRRWRLVTLLAWMIVATLIGGWSLGELANFDYGQSDDVEVVVRSFALQVTIYSVACEMFIAGACARRAFQKYDGL